MAYPRSFLGLLLTGVTLVTLPLVGALAYSAWHTEQLAEQSRNAVFSASQAARASRRCSRPPERPAPHQCDRRCA